MPVLSRREEEIARLAARGLSNRGTAERLFVSVRTVEGHLHRLYAKLGVSDRSELAPLVLAHVQNACSPLRAVSATDLGLLRSDDVDAIEGLPEA